MPSNLITNFGSGDDISPEHISQYAKPINDLESGAAFYRAVTNTNATYEVDFSSSCLSPGEKGHFLSSLSAGQMIVFKASADSQQGAELQVTLEEGMVTHPLYADGAQIGAGTIKTGQLVMAIFSDEGSGRFDVIGQRSGRLDELQNLDIDQGELITVAQNGELTPVLRGNTGDVLTMVLGAPKWESPGSGGFSGSPFLTGELVAYGHHYEEITNVSDTLKSSAFVPESGKTYLIRWTPNHTDSVGQLDLDAAISNSQDHFCRAAETGSSTVHDIGFSSANVYDYDATVIHRTRAHEFVWTSSTNNEVQIELGQPSLDYGEFTGTLVVYEVNDDATNLGWGQFGTGYRWLEDPSNQTNSLSGGTYLSGVSLDANKTYAFVGKWNTGYSIKLVLRQGTNYWNLPPKSDSWEVASGSDNAFINGMYYENSNSTYRGEFIRFFSPPSTGTFELGCAFFGVLIGSFWLIEMP